MKRIRQQRQLSGQNTQNVQKKTGGNAHIELIGQMVKPVLEKCFA